MGDLVKKGFYIKEEQMSKLATLVYEARKEQKRFVNESMVVRIGLDLILKAPINLADFDNEEQLRAYLAEKQLVFK